MGRPIARALLLLRRLTPGVPHGVTILVIVTLMGCTASWRAPVESRGESRTERQRTSPSTVVTRPARKPVAPRIGSDGEYRVQRGDTLYGIAWQTGKDHRSIARWNGLRPPYRIYAGQTLTLKAPVQQAVAPRPPAAKARNRPRKASTEAPTAATSQRDLRWSWPFAGRVMSTYKPDDPLRSGIKIGGKSGAEIRAAESGRVVYSGSGLIGYGRLIIVKHNEKYLSAYGHNRKLLVEEGEQVAKGQPIAEMGTANDGKPLLHFEIRRDGNPVDPLKLLPRR